jgi:hypothetical protein
MSKLNVSKSKKYTWPPTIEQIKDIATSALNKSQDKDVSVLVYWDNPTIMIFEPIHFADTRYIKKKYEHNERSIEVIIGKED